MIIKKISGETNSGKTIELTKEIDTFENTIIFDINEDFKKNKTHRSNFTLAEKFDIDKVPGNKIVLINGSFENQDFFKWIRRMEKLGVKKVVYIEQLNIFQD